MRLTRAVPVCIVQELAKLRVKITSTVQVLTHLKEKLQFVFGESLVEKEKLREIEELVARVCQSLLARRLSPH